MSTWSDDDGELWQENVPAVVAFLAVQSQWRVVGLSGAYGARIVWIGLDYAAARAGLDLAGLDVTPSLWEDVRTMEREAVNALNAAWR